MNKKLIFFFFLTIITSLAVNVMAGGWISAKLSSIPLFEKYHILNPRAPIVITKREEVKAGDSTDILDAVNKAKSRLSSIVTIADNRVVVNGGAINLSADGYFLTTQAAIAKDASTQSIILNNGQHAPIKQVWGETDTNLAIVKVDLSGVPVTEFGSSKALMPAQKLGFVHSLGVTTGSVYFQESYVTSGQNNNSGREFSADKPTRSFGAQAVGALILGEVVINFDGKVVGLWDGQNLVSSDVLNETVRQFFSNGQTLSVRPQWRFSYRNIDKKESELFQIPVGALVVGVEPIGPALAGGLKAGDSITAIGGRDITEDITLEELLQSQKSGEAVGFTIVRDKKLMTVTITPGT